MSIRRTSGWRTKVARLSCDFTHLQSYLQIQTKPPIISALPFPSSALSTPSQASIISSLLLQTLILVSTKVVVRVREDVVFAIDRFLRGVEAAPDQFNSRDLDKAVANQPDADLHCRKDFAIDKTSNRACSPSTGGSRKGSHLYFRSISSGRWRGRFFPQGTTCS